jgi:hypothetical protein
MIRFVLRLFGILLLAAGFVSLIYDGARWIADRIVHFTSVEEAWNIVSSSDPQVFRPAVERALGPWAWDPVIQTLLKQPTWLVLGILGAFLILLGRKKKKLIGYARD